MLDVALSTGNCARILQTPAFSLALSLGVLLAAECSHAADPVELKSRRKPGDMAKVEALLEVGGELKTIVNNQVKPLKMSVVGKIAYDERFLDHDPTRPQALRSVRHYDRAEAAIKVEQGGMKPELRPGLRLVAVESADGTNSLFCPTGLLSRDELELIDIPGSSLLLESLLPGKPVTSADAWPVPEAIVQALVGLEVLNQSDVTCHLVEVVDSAAKVEFAGRVLGAMGGVASDMEIKGRYSFDVAAGCVTRLALLIKESRSIGHAAPGLDVVARLQLKLTPGASSEALTDKALGGLPLSPLAGLMGLSHESTTGQFRFDYDRRWHVMTDSPDGVSLRLVERGDLIAQCNVAALPRIAPGKVTPLARFQEDVQKSLDKNFSQFVHASQGTTTSGYTVYRVVAQGVVAELPIRWIYYLVADNQGRQVIFAFTLEEDLIQRFGDADRALALSLRLDASPQAVPTEETPKTARAQPVSQ